ncbi:MAG: DUF1566 domain-containing protein [Bacteroidales bacterium]|nr:DUF1566 domain-containing protein [Bacteroidales bacterium]
MNHLNRYILPATCVLMLFLSITAHAQAPEGFNYSAIVRDNIGNPLFNQAVSFRFSIVRGNVTGTVVYSETHNTMTDALGQVSLIIGNGAIISGVFANIDWGGDAYFLKVELDKTGGNSYVEMGISQFLSVPYALYAKKAGSGGGIGGGNITAGNNISITGSGTEEDPYVLNEKAHYVGESYGGGIVFYVFDNGRHGLIASVVDQDPSIQWYNGVKRYSNTAGDGIGTGEMNTEMIIAQQTNDEPMGNFAAKLCADYSVIVDGVSFGDWYLPSKYELAILFMQRDLVGNFDSNYYWSSTELSSVSAWCQDFSTGVVSNLTKSFPLGVRAIRSF